MAADLESYVATLQGLDGVTPGPIGVTGYCMGARVAVRAASLHPDVVAAAGGFHGGGLVTEADDSPHLGLANARAAFVFGHADNDGSNTPEAIAELEQALTSAGLAYSSSIYPGAPHGYSMADTAMYHEEAAERHFQRAPHPVGRPPASRLIRARCAPCPCAQCRRCVRQ